MGRRRAGAIGVLLLVVVTFGMVLPSVAGEHHATSAQPLLARLAARIQGADTTNPTPIEREVALVAVGASSTTSVGITDDEFQRDYIAPLVAPAAPVLAGLSLNAAKADQARHVSQMASYALEVAHQNVARAWPLPIKQEVDHLLRDAWGWSRGVNQGFAHSQTTASHRARRERTSGCARCEFELTLARWCVLLLLALVSVASLLCC